LTSAERPRARRLVLCATGAYQVFTLPGFVLALLRHAADDVRVVLSASAARLVSVAAVEAASHHPVLVGGGGDDEAASAVAEDADLVVVYPATVNVVAKLASGLADDAVCGVVLSTAAPVIVVPFGNPKMWAAPAAAQSLARLQEIGYAVLPPLSGVEVATREGLAESTEPFPLPTLLARMTSALRRH
jgi:phosphopantothenoylcysteine decarboxylase/phosphopantothenate--cysteine ligase